MSYWDYLFESTVIMHKMSTYNLYKLDKILKNY